MEQTTKKSSINRLSCSSDLQKKNDKMLCSKESTVDATTAADSLVSNMESALNLNSSTNDSDENQTNNNDNSLMINDSTISSSIKDDDGSSGRSQNPNNNISNNNVPKFGVPVPNRVFVGGIPDDATDNDVQQLFAQYGSIHSVKIITDRAGISKGYGFVTFERDEDAQKVIKEADNLIIKNRKLNVSPAVMKHQNYLIEQRMFQGGAFLYPQIPFSTAANYSQFYENLHYCPAEGLPLYQIAGMNGHFVSNCPSLLTAPAPPQYMAQPASAYSAASYQSPGYIYPNVQPTNSSMQMPSQHSMYNVSSSQHLNQHLLSPGAAAALSVSHAAFQYQTAATAAAAASLAPNGNNPGSMPTLRYPLPLVGPNPNSTQSQITMNNVGPHQQYIQYSNNATAVGNQSMHLPTMSDMQNSNATSPPTHSGQIGSNGGGQTASQSTMNAGTMMHHVATHGNQSSSMYQTYPSNMANMAANSNPLQNVNFKTDISNNIEMIDIPSGLMNTPAVSSSLAQISNTVHIANGGYSSHLFANDMMWTSTHVPHNHAAASAAFCAVGGTNQSAISLNNQVANNANKSHHQQMINNNNNQSHSSTSSSSHHQAYTSSKSSPPNVNHANSSSSQSKSFYNSNSNQQQNHHSQQHQSSQSSSTKDNKQPITNSRHNNHNSSYTSSHHKKMYNGNNHNNNNNYNVPYHQNSKNNNNYNSNNKMINGGSTATVANIINNNNNNNGRSGHDPVEHCERANIKTHYHSKQQTYSSQNSYRQSHNHNHNAIMNNNHNSINTTNSNQQQQTLITKTINGVQIYALADNTAATLNGAAGGAGSENHPINHNATNPIANNATVPYKT